MELEKMLNLDIAPYKNSLDLLKNGELAWVTISGKMCSGKDTYAEKLELPNDSVIVSYSNILRRNMNKILDIVRADNYNFPLCSIDLVRNVDFNRSKINEIYLAAFKLLKKDENVTAFVRNDDVRNFLQKLGSDWLPNEYYLPRESFSEVMGIIENGNSVVTASCRFPADVEIPHMAGAISLRIDITKEQQLERLFSRDGIIANDDTMKMLKHEGETILDDWKFDLRFDNSVDGDDAISSLSSRINKGVEDILNDRRRMK